MITTIAQWARGGRVLWLVCLLAGLAVFLSAAWSGSAFAQAATDAATAAAAPAPATPPPIVVNKADNAWMMVSSLLVLFMTVPGLALFYGGMVRTKNMASVLTQVFMIQCVVCVIWFIYGYSLAFTSGSGVTAPFIGGFSRLFLGGMPINSIVETFSIGVGIHELVFICFEMTFAAITTALVIGGFVERIKFGTLCIFAVLWMTFVYCPISHMVWFWPGPTGIASDPSSASTGGFLWQLGALDFAGGTVVHVNAGIAALVGALMLGRRIGFRKEPMPPHSVTLTMVGAAILWVGWFGFNAGSNLEANEYATLAMANTFVATAAAGISWMFFEWIFKGKPSLLGLSSGVVAGLVAVTPASGFAGPMGALVLGLVVSPVCLFFCTVVKNLLGYDDTLDVFGVHAIGGTVGAIGTGIAVNPDLGGAGIVDYTTCAAHAFTSCDSAAYNLVGQLTSQIKDVLMTYAWSGIGTFLIFLVLSLTFGLRVSEEAEREGLDITEHGEQAYNY
jgi:Amt family ammonium transporter